MRRGLAIFLTINCLIIIFLIRSVFTLLTLLVEDGSADAIHSADIPPPDSPRINDRPQLIPKIIHQTYIDENVPERWREAQKSCVDLHEDYEYYLWTDAKSRELIATEYPWFLNTFDNYSQPIQRADAIRYFVLAHYGGIYIDLDDGCNRRLDPLLSYPAWVRRTNPTGISNDAMGSVPHHPFFTLVIESLIPYNRNWKFPYITVMYSTGPLFLSVIWQEYKRANARGWDGSPAGRVRVLMGDEYNQQPWAFFRWHGGSSWHGKDARLIFWMGKHWKLLTASGFLIAGFVGLGLWWIYGRVLLLGERRKRSSKNGPNGWAQRMPLWKTASATAYELTDRHEV
ncbi:nucleotide-diphospho-sugar transferase [Usnea florida]